MKYFIYLTTAWMSLLCVVSASSLMWFQTDSITLLVQSYILVALGIASFSWNRRVRKEF